MELTLDEVIDQLMQIRQQSPLKGQTVVFVCVPDYEYCPVTSVKLTDHETPEPSGCVIFQSQRLDNILTAHDRPGGEE